MFRTGLTATLVLACTLALALPGQAAIQYQDIAAASLAGRDPGVDGYIGTVDDPAAGGPFPNPFGAASYVLTDLLVGADVLSYVVGSSTLASYSSGGGISSTDWSRSATAASTNGAVTFTSDINTVGPHLLAVGGNRHVSLGYRENHVDFGPVNTQFDLAFTGYAVFNTPGLDDPYTIAGIDAATAAYINVLKTLVPAGWTQIVLTLMVPTVFTAGINVHGDLAPLFHRATATGVGAAYTTDPLALTLVPIPAAGVLFAAVLPLLLRRRIA